MASDLLDAFPVDFSDPEFCAWLDSVRFLVAHRVAQAAGTKSDKSIPDDVGARRLAFLLDLYAEHRRSAGGGS